MQTFPGSSTFPSSSTFPGDDGVIPPRSALAHLEAVADLIAPLGYAVYLVDVPTSPAFPYVLLWSSAGRLIADAICDEQTDLDDLLGVTNVGGSPAAAMTVAGAVRTVLMDAEPDVDGWSSLLRLFDTRTVEVDREVTIPELGRHPSYAVDIYRYRSTPITAPEGIKA